MAIETTSQSVKIDEVTKVIVTDVQQDEVSGEYVREVRVYGTPTVGGPAPQVFVLRLGAVQRPSIAIATPESAF